MSIKETRGKILKAARPKTFEYGSSRRKQPHGSILYSILYTILRLLVISLRKEAKSKPSKVDSVVPSLTIYRVLR